MGVQHKHGSFLGALISGACLAFVPSMAAEKLTFTYGPFSRSLEVNSLEMFAETGDIPDDLRPYLKNASADRKEKLRAILDKQVEISPMLLSRFLYTPIGEDVIRLLGNSIKLPSGANGRLAIRSAMVGAALSDEGLSVLNVMRQLPTDVKFDGNYILAVKKEVDTVLVGTNTVVDLLRKLSAQEAEAEPQVDYTQLQDITASGPYAVKEETWNLADPSRDRSFYLKVYRPNPLPAGNTSVIVFSHGLMSSPEAYRDGLKNLASRGYFVAAPQHPGSDAIWFKGLADGFHAEKWLTSMNLSIVPRISAM